MFNAATFEDWKMEKTQTHELLQAIDHIAVRVVLVSRSWYSFGKLDCILFVNALLYILLICSTWLCKWLLFLPFIRYNTSQYTTCSWSIESIVSQFLFTMCGFWILSAQRDDYILCWFNGYIFFCCNTCMWLFSIACNLPSLCFAPCSATAIFIFWQSLLVLSCDRFEYKLSRHNKNLWRCLYHFLYWMSHTCYVFCLYH